MPEDLSHTLDEAITRLQAGESLEECLAHYPDAADDLGPLLHLASAVHQQATTPLPLEMEAWVPAGRREIEAVAAQILPNARRNTAARPAISSWLAAFATAVQGWFAHLRQPPRLNAPRLAATALVAVALFLLVPIVNTTAAETVPGDFLYPWKRVQENVTLAFTPDPIQRNLLRVEYANERLEEFEKLVNQSPEETDTAQTVRVLDLFDEQVQTVIEDAKQTGTTPEVQRQLTQLLDNADTTINTVRGQEQEQEDQQQALQLASNLVSDLKEELPRLEVRNDASAPETAEAPSETSPGQPSVPGRVDVTAITGPPQMGDGDGNRGSAPTPRQPGQSAAAPTSAGTSATPVATSAQPIAPTVTRPGAPVDPTPNPGGSPLPPTDAAATTTTGVTPQTGVGESSPTAAPNSSTSAPTTAAEPSPDRPARTAGPTVVLPPTQISRPTVTPVTSEPGSSLPTSPISTVTVTPTATMTPTSTITPGVTLTPTVSVPLPSPTATVTATTSATVTPTATVMPTVTVTQTNTPSIAPPTTTPTTTPSIVPPTTTPTSSPTPSPTNTVVLPTVTPTATQTPMPATQGNVSPVLECVVPKDEAAAILGEEVLDVLNPAHEGKDSVRPATEPYLAVFGYNNKSTEAMRIPVGDDNKFSPTPQNRGQPELFESGRQREVFVVEFTDGNLVWNLDGRTATASTDSKVCEPPPDDTEAPAPEAVEPMNRRGFR